MQRIKHFILSCKINCYFRAFLPSPFCPSINSFPSHISLPNFYRSQNAITGSSGDSGKCDDGLIAISSLSGRLFFSRCPLLSSPHYNPSAYNFSARPDQRLRLFFERPRGSDECLLKNEEWIFGRNARSGSLWKDFNGESSRRDFNEFAITPDEKIRGCAGFAPRPFRPFAG